MRHCWVLALKYLVLWIFPVFISLSVNLESFLISIATTLLILLNHTICNGARKTSFSSLRQIINQCYMLISIRTNRPTQSLLLMMLFLASIKSNQITLIITHISWDESMNKIGLDSLVAYFCFVTIVSIINLMIISFADHNMCKYGNPL